MRIKSPDNDVDPLRDHARSSAGCAQSGRGGQYAAAGALLGVLISANLDAADRPLLPT